MAADYEPDKVLAYHTVSHVKQEVPAFWLDDEISPFPGQWREAPSSLSEVGRETAELPEDFEPEEVELPAQNVAGDIVLPPLPVADSPVAEDDTPKSRKATKAASK